MSHLFHILVRGFNNIIPERHVAGLRDMVLFQCGADDVIWKFNNGPLPPAAFVYTNDMAGLSTLAIIVHNDVYFGQYSCMGDSIANKIAFYDVGILSKRGTQAYSIEKNAMR